MWRNWLKGKSTAAKQGRRSRTSFKPTLETLEVRVVPSFTSAVSYNVGAQPDIFIPNAAPESVATADLNGATLNGKPILDLIEVHNYNQTSSGPGYVDVLMGNGNGTFQAPVRYNTTADLDGDVLTGDFTNNGKIDLILPTAQTAAGNGYVEMLGNGDGTFQAPIYSAPNVFIPNNNSGTYARGWAVGQFTGSGNLDLVANDVGVGVTVLPGNGNGTFGTPIFTPVSMGYSRWIAVGDFNGDGKDDLVIADGTGANNQESPGAGQGGSEITVLLGNGNGTFGPAVHYAAPPTPDPGGDGLGGGDILNPEDVTVAALVPGGPLDVIESLYDHSIDVFMGNGDGTFQPAVGYTTGEYPRDVQVADLTGNGIPDLIVDNVGVGPGGAASFAEGYEDGSIAVMMGNGDGTFQAPIQYNSVYYPGYVAVGDFNNDGLPDLAVTGVDNTSTINIMLNEPASDPVTLASPASAAGILPDQPASIFANSPTGMTTQLSALGADSSSGAASLTYTWSTLSKPSGAANPTFSINDSNAAQNTTATFSGFGVYTFEVTITDPSGNSTTSSVQVYAVQNTPPTMGSAPIVVVPSPVGGTSATLEVPLGSNNNGVESDNGYVNLTYTWATVGTPPAPVTFTQVGLPQTETGFVYATGNSFVCDYETTATFTKAGNYSFQVTITDPEGDSITSSDVNVTVNQTLTSIVVTPNPVNVADDTTRQFTATGLDQFGNPLTAQPTFTWSSSGLGSVNSSGLYTAPATGTGSATVKASSGSRSGSASVTVTVTSDQPPTVVTPASATPNPVTGTTTNLNVLGADPDFSASTLTYTWTSTGPATVTFSANGTNAAQNTTATFTKAGTYNFVVTITDPVGLTAPSTVGVTVNQTLTSITLAPATATVADNLTQQFTATADDQFGNALTAQPAFTWSVTGLGSINGSGLYSAPASGTGSATVTATSGAVSGTASVTVTSTVTPPATDTWTGLGTTNNWSDAANWSADVAPGAPTTVIFNGTSSKNAIVDAGFGGTVAAVQINSGYAGTVSLGENLAVTGAFTEQAGTYNDGSFTTNVTGLTTVSGGIYQASMTADTLTGGLTVSGGTFTGSTGTVTTGNVTLSSGTLNAPSGTLDLTGGNFTYTGGIFNADEGIVAYSGSGTPTVSATGLKFYNFQDSLAASPSTLTINGTLTVTGTFSIMGSSRVINGNIEAQGNVDDENHGGIGNPILTLDGSANQTIEDLSGSGGGQFRTITINKSGGTVSLACNPTVFSGLTLTAGTVNTGAFSWFLGSAGPVSAASGLSLGNIEIDGSNVTVSSASLQVANVAFAAASDKFTAPTGNLFVSGNWNNSVAGSFTPNGGTVVFDGAGGTQQLTSGGKAFNNLTVAAGASVQLEDNLTISGVFTDLGTLALNGHTITYNQTLTSISVAPATASVADGLTQSFSATALDQLGRPLTTQPAFTWSVTGLGSINSSGLYSAPAAGTGAGSAIVSATSGSVIGTASVTVTADQPPTVATPASATPNPVTGTTTNLSVLGADADFAASSLTYTWATTGTPPAPVAFSVNGTNAAQNTTATFTAAGTYNFLVTITDPANLTVTISVSVTVNQTLSAITVAPATASVADGLTQSFSATALDQFGTALATQPTFTWSAAGLGTINGSGLYSAPASGTGSATVTATSGSLSGAASVTITADQPPTVVTPASATVNPVTGTTTNLNVLGADPDFSSSTLIYAWTSTGPAVVSFSANGTDAAQNTTATFTKAGTYNFVVTITDPVGLTATSTVSVTVNQTLTSIALAPATATVADNLTQQFSATGYDQFGAALTAQPAFSWSVTGLGSINGSGLYSAPASGTGSATVTATSGSVGGTANVTVASGTPPATDNWTGLGTTNNWSDAANWSADAAPGAPTTVIFNGTSSKNALVDAGFLGTVAAVQINSGYAGTVSLNENLTVTGAFTESAGTFSAGANTLFVGGNFTVSAGTFNAGTGTVTFDQSNSTGTTVTVSAVGVNFNNITVSQSNPSSGLNVLTIGGSTTTLTVNGTFTYAGGGNTAIGSGTLNLAGNLDDQKFDWTGSPVFVFDGSGNQTIMDTKPAGSGLANEGLSRNVIINKPSGTLFLTTDLTVFGNLTLTAGTVNTGSFSWLLGNSGMTITDTSGGNLGNINLYGTRTVNSASLAVANVTFVAGYVTGLTGPTGNLFVTGNWNNSAGGSFTPNGGTVVFDGASGTTQQVTSGGKAFNNLTIAAGSTLELEANVTILDAFINSGVLIPNGFTVTIG